MFVDVEKQVVQNSIKWEEENKWGELSRPIASVYCIEVFSCTAVREPK